MLEELTAYKTFGSVGHITEIMRSIMSAPCTVGDLFVIAGSNSTVEIPRIRAAVALLEELKLCETVDDRITGSESMATIVSAKQALGLEVGLILLQRMLDEGLLPIEKIGYDLDAACGYLRQRDISLRYSQMRNFLLDAGILVANKGKLLFGHDASLILQSKAAALDGGMTPAELLEKIERDKEAGAAAESFAMEFERKRLGPPIAEAIRQVSLVSVSAGYDIASFESTQSNHYDRFIEVKAIGGNGFHLSASELLTAKKLGKHYYLYLVDMRKKDLEGYRPEIIQDPSEFLAESSDWRVMPESYHITRISL